MFNLFPFNKQSYLYTMSKELPTEKKIEDYLHLHLGCEIVFEKSNYYFVHNFGIHNGDVNILTASLLHCIKFHSEGLIYKIRLRPLSDMTEEEAIELAQIQKYNIPEDEGVREELISIYSDDGELRLGTHYLPISMYKDGLLWLLKHGFDLFGQIDLGIAIDKTKIQQP